MTGDRGRLPDPSPGSPHILDNGNAVATPNMKKPDILAALVIIPMCLYVFYESGTWPIPALLGNPLLIPRLVAGCLLVAAGALLYRALTGRALPLENRLQGADLRRVSGAAGLTGGYVFVMERLGFIATSFLFLLLFGVVLGERRWIRLVLVAIAVPIAMYVLFDTTLNVPLPQGWLR
jgi:putative tricarboxylic transport membrane protein